MVWLHGDRVDQPTELMGLFAQARLDDLSLVAGQPAMPALVVQTM